MRVRMVPSMEQVKGSESGIATVIRKYYKHLPKLGVTLADGDEFDILHVHAGMMERYDSIGAPIVSSLHGIYWTADQPSALWMHDANRKVVESIRRASEVTVPSDWVNETLARDMHFEGHVIPHGIDFDEWANHDYENAGYIVSYAKNRAGVDVSSPATATELARRLPGLRFVATFADGEIPDNLLVTGLVSHSTMKEIVQQASVYVSPVKETFGIGALEAMAAGVPVLTVNVGQVPHLVKHGVGGYCYNQNSVDDMINGLKYCLEHRDALGRNAQEIAKTYTWEGAVKKLYGVYEMALEPSKGTVDVIIPVYNKEIKDVRRAIESCLDQSRQPNSVIVVDDGSDNGSDVREAVEEYAERGRPVEYIRQRNLGVAHARNRGISRSDADYIVCLDADDAIEPEFIEVCRGALERDRSLWIAYTRLRWVKPDGSTGVSEWPGEWDYDGFLERKNQVPTCCMFRRSLYRRLGGYRQRYAPTGAGAEDAEFFARAGAYGYKAQLVTSDPLFVYSWQSGHTAQEGYREVNWMDWHVPWLNGTHPFASYASPENRIAHPVRQYDEPAVSVIIPVGPDHGMEVINALDSLENQTFTKWEVILVWDGVPKGNRDYIEDAYPFARIVHDYDITRGALSLGAGKARNEGAKIARGKLLLFLDADDWLYPDFLGKTLSEWNKTGNGVYTDYAGEALVEDVSRLAPDLQKNVLSHEDGVAVIGYRASDYDCEKAQRQPDMPKPYIWCNITTLIPKRWHEEIGGFDESMNSWEDVDYWWRMARAGKCFTRLDERLMVYRFYSGGRRDEGLKSHKELARYIGEKYKGEKVEMCGCRKTKSSSSAYARRASASAPTSSTLTIGGREMEDKDLVMVEYNHPNIGQHPVVGPVTRIKYGYRAGGDRFLVHKDDVSHDSHMFKPVRRESGGVMVEEEQQPTPPPPPQPPAVEEQPELPDQQQFTPLDLSELDLSKRVIQNLARKGFVTEERVLEAGVEGLTEVKWVGEATAQEILEHVESRRQ